GWVRSLSENVMIPADHTHTYDSVTIPATCEHGGWTVYTCACGDSYEADFTDATGHSYENGICVSCQEDHPNLHTYEDKVISILSASTSTFAGYIPIADGFNLEHRARYPQDNLLTDVNDTWWMQAITALGAKLGINDSWAGSQVTNTKDTNSGDLGPDAAMASITRIQNLGANGTPDVILFFGAGNDMGRNIPAGSFDPATAPTAVDLTTTKWETLADAYVTAIMRLQHFYPDAKIVAMSTYAMPSYVTAAKLDKYGPTLRAICEHYGVEYLSLRDCGVTFDMLPDKIHPNAEGMDHITAAVMEKLLSDVALDAGANTVYPITHNLTNATASKHYYKGVSAGSAFTEVMGGGDLSVTVTMGGTDITADCYANGVITIPEITGELVITAKGKFNADGHLQELPDHVCAGTNLWQVLEPENIYYTATGWGLFANQPDVHSVTFPVVAGERVWATSFGAYPGNGSGANGTRITWFDENGVLKTVTRDVVYAEFIANGYITVPEGAVALNLPMTGNQDHYAVYILSAEHTYTTLTIPATCTEGGWTVYTCTTCGHEYEDDFTEPTGHAYKNGVCTECGQVDTRVELFDGFSSTDFFLKSGILSDGKEYVIPIYSNTHNARMAIIPLSDGATYHIKVKNNDQGKTNRMKICTFNEPFKRFCIAPLASEQNMNAVNPLTTSVAADVIYWDTNSGEGCVSEYEGTFTNSNNAKTLVLFVAWGAEPSLVEVSVTSEDHQLDDAEQDPMYAMIKILQDNMLAENSATQDIMQIACGFWEHRDEFIYCSGTALDQPWNYWSYTGYVDSSNTGKTVTAENSGYKRIDCSTFVRYVINGIEYYSTPYYNALELTEVEQGGLENGVEVNHVDTTVCRTGAMYVRAGKKLILESKESKYSFTKVYGYDASDNVIQTLISTDANTVFV
ncbi:MAG: hypothetical protein IIU63_07530, partial [Clostridia bacterium]|nr:hypothetical protein [Clostridia bacterium]